MDYQILKPTGFLINYIQYYWIIESNPFQTIHTERVIPQDFVQLMFHFGDRFFQQDNSGNIDLQPQSFICGLKNKFYDLSSTGKIGILGVCFFPHTASNFFRFPLNEIFNSNLSFDLLFGKNYQVVEEQLFLAKNNLQRIEIVENFLKKNFFVNRTIQNRLQATIQKIYSSNKNLSIKELADTACLSQRQFERIFLSNIGISPKLYQRIVRFTKTIEKKNIQNTSSLIDLTYDSGYYDQAHFINEFKQFTGYTPKEFFLYKDEHESAIMDKANIVESM